MIPRPQGEPTTIKDVLRWCAEDENQKPHVCLYNGRDVSLVEIFEVKLSSATVSFTDTEGRHGEAIVEYLGRTEPEAMLSYLGYQRKSIQSEERRVLDKIQKVCDDYGIEADDATEDEVPTDVVEQIVRRPIQLGIKPMSSKLWENVEKLKELTEIQCSDGNWDFNEYMHGMANGMLLAMATILDRNPEYLDAPEEWGGCDIGNNDNDDDEGPSVSDIVKDYLQANGYDGLIDGEGCGCDGSAPYPCVDGPYPHCRAAFAGPGGKDLDGNDCDVLYYATKASVKESQRIKEESDG